MSQYVVYEFRNDAGEMLYVGSTGRLWARLEQHGKDTPWWDEVASVRVDGPYEDRRAARVAEQAAIDRGMPARNLYRAHGAGKKRSVRIPDEDWNTAVANARENGDHLSTIIRDHLAAYISACAAERSA